MVDYGVCEKMIVMRNIVLTQCYTVPRGFSYEKLFKLILYDLRNQTPFKLLYLFPLTLCT